MNSQAKPDYVGRLNRLRTILAEQRLDALLVTTEKDIWYLTGFLGHDSLLVVWAGGTAAIISDPRYDEFLDPWKGGQIAEVVMGQRHRLEESVASLLSSSSTARLGVQGETMTLARRSKLAAAVDSLEVVETTGLVSRLRMRKDAGEIALIERAINVQQDALEAALTGLEVGMSEMHFCAILEYEMKIRGSFAPAFDTMIASGPRSSVIHYQTSDRAIGEGTLLIDWGAIVDGYHSDLTRTISIGPLPTKVAEMYAIVFDAQAAAIDAIKPGKTCAEIDAIARKVIRDAGYGDYFGHGLGHGLGMDTHEPPFFNNLQTDVALEPGMVMTVEPGIYLPGIGGVRIEDDVLVTENGSRVLSNFPKRIDEVERGVNSEPTAAALGAQGKHR